MILVSLTHAHPNGNDNKKKFTKILAAYQAINSGQWHLKIYKFLFLYHYFEVKLMSYMDTYKSSRKTNK